MKKNVYNYLDVVDYILRLRRSCVMGILLLGGFLVVVIIPVVISVVSAVVSGIAAAVDDEED